MKSYVLYSFKRLEERRSWIQAVSSLAGRLNLYDGHGCPSDLDGFQWNVVGAPWQLLRVASLTNHDQNRSSHWHGEALLNLLFEF